MYVTSSAVTLVLGIPLARVNLGGTVNSEYNNNNFINVSRFQLSTSAENNQGEIKKKKRDKKDYQWGNRAIRCVGSNAVEEVPFVSCPKYKDTVKFRLYASYNGE